ncbi:MULTISPECIES: phycocyanobilin:ferredoxin oxidoreductase [unclassified Prochlorococcus]|uniref:phycocyanobilin:ferredoxin oxidoreductase n=1 Tax=unclassified Prochlorococcus TaxID=2627481 RepID=UPI001F4D0696|nr:MULTISPECIES: phycocyanobilin:ferredoxin oxidoreductase [unclassified Prochlorococcus]
MTNVAPLELEPDLKNIYGKSEGDDLFIVNELNQARGFRKLHLETAKLGSSLEVLHAVFFPDPLFDLPIFGVDLVAVPGIISAAIVDLSPVSKSLPSAIDYDLSKLKFPSFKIVRELPEWGDIFSPYVQFVSPMNSNENKSFLNLVDSYLNILICYSASIDPQLHDDPRVSDRYNRQKYYCLQQKRNDKTRNVLAKTFGMPWANQYIDKVLFDLPSKSEL